MERVYLKNGQECYLNEKIGNRFIISKIYIYDEYESIGDEEIVNEIFINPPKEKINSEISELELKKKTIQSEISILNGDRNKLKSEVLTLTKTKIDSEKFVINRSDILKAKELVLFPKDKVMPIVRKSEDKSFRGLKVVIDISIADGKERVWGYKLYYDYNDSYSEYLCDKFGILINPTQKEIDDVIEKRLAQIEFSDYSISVVPDEYLSIDLLNRKNLYLENERITKQQSKERQIEKLKKELENLQK